MSKLTGKLMFDMWKANQQESERKIQLAVAEIHRTVSEGKPISVSELSRNTGLSKGFLTSK